MFRFARPIILLLFAATAVLSKPERPEFDLHARVKQHRAGAQGELVKGEEDLRKVIVQWERIPNAQDYEVCHMCHVNESTGDRFDDSIGDIHEIPNGQECGARPCFVFPKAPPGFNVFHLRVKVGDEWSLWSKHRNFEVYEPGRVLHSEL